MPPKRVKRIEDYDPNWQEELERKQPKLQKFKIVDGADGYPRETWNTSIVLDLNRLADDVKADIEAGLLVPEEFDTAIMAAAQAATANLELTVPDPDTNAILVDRGEMGLFVKDVLIDLARSSLLWSGAVIRLHHRVVSVPSRKIKPEFRSEFSDVLSMLILRLTWHEPTVTITNEEELKAADPAALINTNEVFYLCGILLDPLWQAADGMAFIDPHDLEDLQDEYLEYDEETDEGVWSDAYYREIETTTQEMYDLFVNAMISQGVAVIEDEGALIRQSTPSMSDEERDEIDDAMQVSVPEQYGSKIIILPEA